MRTAAAAAIVVVLGTVPAAAGPRAGPAATTETGAPPASGFREWLVPPVDGAIVRRFQAPGTDWGPGHRGIDFASGPGTLVRAAAAGTVIFAGRVGGGYAVTVDHSGGLETTYTWLRDVVVVRGQTVTAGTYLARTDEAHPDGGRGLHFGVRLTGRYVDPEHFLGPLDVAGAISLAPVEGVLPATSMAADYFPRTAGTAARACTDPPPAPAPAPAPTDNVVVAIGGLGSTSESAAAFGLPRRLGYPAARMYRFSYRGLDGADLHARYSKEDTWADLRTQARRLRALLEEIGNRHPTARVDILAHSMGGLVARAYLAHVADGWDPALPQVEHLVTLATPHLGTTLADLKDKVSDAALIGGALARVAFHPARAAGLNPYARSVAQMETDSPFIAGLAATDVVLGTRSLALSAPGDPIVPAHRARYEGGISRAVAPEFGSFEHSGIARWESTRRHVYAFLRGGPPPCRTGLDTRAGLAGRMWDVAYTYVVPEAASWVEGKAGRLLKWGGRRIRDGIGNRNR